MGVNIEGIAIEMGYTATKYEFEQTINSESGQYNSVKFTSDWNELYFQGSLGSDFVAFGYTNLAQGGEKSKTSGKYKNIGTFGEKNNSYWYRNYIQYSESNIIDNTYGFSFKFSSIYFGYALNVIEEKDKKEIYEGTLTVTDLNGNIFQGYENINENNVTFYEDIEKKYHFYGIAYYFNNIDGNAFHLESNLKIHPEKRIIARNSTYNTSESNPTKSENIKFEFRYEDGFLFGIEGIKDYTEKPSWSQSDVYPLLVNTQYGTVGLQLDFFEILYQIAFSESNNNGVKSTSAVNSLGITFIF